MNVLTLVALGALLGMLILQAVLGCGFARRLFRKPKPLPADEQCPRATVILCLRGSDPFLPACIRCLLRQDYPDYDILILVDSPDDPAWDVAADILAASPGAPAAVRPLRFRRPTCSLKCSSLVQAVAELDESCEAAAFLDADVIPHPSWLRELVAPLADPRCGAATGNRWFMPVGSSWGALVRRLWNAGAVVMMYWSGIAWGGSLALKANVLRESDLTDRWGRAFCEDTMVYDALRRLGLRLAFVPSVMMINREDCRLADFFRWVARQLLCSRLYHSRWPLVPLQCAAASGVLLLGLALFVAAAVAGRWGEALWLGGALAAYQAGMLSIAAVLEAAVRRIARARGEPAGWAGGRAATRAALALPLTQAVYAAAMCAALSMRRAEWRGVSYEIKGPWNIRLIEYKPFQPGPASESASRSL